MSAIKFLNYCFCLFVIMFSSMAVAEVAPRGGAATDQTQALIQQLGSERTRLTAENAKLKKKLKEAESALEQLKKDEEKTGKQLSSVKGKLSEKTNLSEALRERLDQAKNKLDDLVAKFRETITNLREVESESELRAQEIVRLDEELKICAKNNVALSELGYDMLTKYENKGFFDRMAQNEPFTQIKRVQIENLVDEYKYKIEDQEYVVPETEQNITGVK